MHLNGRRVGGARVTSRTTSQRLTVQEAAEVLGTSVDAVRMRVRRGSLPSEKDPDGRVHVWVDADSSETKPRLDGESDALISAKDETIRVLSEQLEAEREAHREARRIIAGLVQRIPELESGAAPIQHQEAHESREEAAESAAEGVPSTNTPVGATGAKTSSEEQPRRRSWWREFFGFGE